MTYTADQIALQAHLETEAAATKAKIASGEYTFATYYTTDLEHWAEMEVFSIDDLRRHDAIASYSDTFKEMHGFRDRSNNWDEMSTEAIEALVDNLFDRAEADRLYEESRKLEEKEEEKDAAKRLGVTLETYLRWQEDAGNSTSRSPEEAW